MKLVNRLKPLAIIGFWSLPLVVCAQNTVRTVAKIPETGITKNYTDSFGEDNDFNINPIKLQNLNNFIVFDSNTMLMWQRSDGGEMTWPKAKLYCDTLTLGGFSDWRLPTPIEAYSILNLERNNPALDVTYFKSTGAEYWYTQLSQTGDTNKVWCTNSGGGIGNHPRTETISMGGTKKFHVRAVRDTWRDTISKRFEVMGNQLIKDNTTQFQWLFFGDTLSITWEKALSYANHYSKYNCRLPNIKELQTVTDYTLIQPCFNKTIFPSTSTSKYWSSSTLFNQSGKAWYLDARFGITTYLDKTSAINLALICNEKSSAGTTISKDPGTNLEAFVISPNPAKDKIQIRAKVSDNYTGELFQLNGLMILNFHLTDLSTSINLDVSELNSGIYLLAIRSQNKNIVHQQLIEISE